MIIDYCGNGDLLKSIAEKIGINEYFEEDEIWKYFIQICFGLESLHNNDFIHRDLQAQNILLDDQNNIKIAGSSTYWFIPKRKAQRVPDCYSPRTLGGYIQTKASDIWAVGCVLYFLCNFEHPFDSISDRIKRGPYKPIRNQYSEEIKHFIDWCLKKKREERPTIIDILSHEFVLNKTIQLGIEIPKTSTMNAAICMNLLNKERKRNKELEKELLAYRQANWGLENQPLAYKQSNETIKKEIEPPKAEIARLNSIIAERINVKPKLEQKISNELNTKLQEIKHAEYLSSLRKKVVEVIRKSNNSELEMYLKRAYENDASVIDSPLMQAYNDYISACQQKACLYYVWAKGDKSKLYSYNTETEAKEIKTLRTWNWINNRPACITSLPNGKLFLFGFSLAGKALKIDRSCGVEKLPSGTPCIHTLCIYFNNSVYCFGGTAIGYEFLTTSSRFDLTDNRWVRLNPMPNGDSYGSGVVNNGNILISGRRHKNLMLYSIDLNSFSIIPYEFEEKKQKILINAEKLDRLYLIGCEGGRIYESDVGNEYVWSSICRSNIDFLYEQVHRLNNKGDAYIVATWLQSRIKCFKFDLNKKSIIEIL